MPEQRIKELELPLQEEKQTSALFDSVIDTWINEHGITVKKPSGRSFHAINSKD